MGSLEFLPIESERYPIWSIKAHILQNPHLGVVVNAANEEAIQAFQQEKCSFFGMSEMVLDAYQRFENVKASNIAEIIQLDKEIRAYVNAR
jgi:1-deoxy-D-xylulose-5-phosphate reductoisomerase